VRITGGKFGGRIFHAPENLPVRPTTDFAKTALFNILSNSIDFEGLNSLDLFAGIGGITFEFLSRDSIVTAVDQHEKCLTFIKEVAKKLNAVGLRTIKSDVFKFLKVPPKEKFNIVFADPPFELKETDKLPDLINQNGFVKENGLIIIEHHSKRELISSLTHFDKRFYGNCAYSFYKPTA
jgi:16S rRNA (guanine966-N2)-methyltransferase